MYYFTAVNIDVCCSAEGVERHLSAAEGEIDPVTGIEPEWHLRSIGGDHAHLVEQAL